MELSTIIQILIAALLSLLVYVYKKETKLLEYRVKVTNQKIEYLYIMHRATDKALEHSLKNGYANARDQEKAKLIQDFELIGESKDSFTWNLS